MIKGRENVIAYLKDKLYLNSVTRSVVFLVGGTAIGQGIYILSTPILSRIYSPADFGVLAIYTALISILGGFTSFSYHLAILLPDSDKLALNIFALSCFLHVGWVGIIFISFYFGGNFSLILRGWGVIEPYKWLLVWGVLFTGFYTIITYLALRFKAYKTIAQTKITQKFFGASTSLFMGVLGFSPSGLLLGQIVGMAGGITSLVWDTLDSSFFSNIHKKDIIYVAKKYSNFPLYQTWGTTLNVLSSQIMPLFLSSFFSSDITGWFAMSMRVLELPASFLGQSIGQVYYQKASVAQREGHLPEVVFYAFNGLVKLGTFPILSLGFIAPELFPLLLGDKWRIAGYYALCLAPCLWAQFLASPISTTFFIVNKQRVLTFFQGFMFVMEMFSLYIGYLARGVFYPIIIYSLIKTIVYFLYLILIMNLVKNRIKEYAIVIIKEFFISVLLILPLAAVHFYMKSSLFTVGVWLCLCIFHLVLTFKKYRKVSL